MDERMEGQLAPLPAGTVAPDFSLPHTPQAHLTLHRLYERPVVLVFYPLDWEPVSREQLALYQDYAGEFDHFGARLLSISIDHCLSHAACRRTASTGRSKASAHAPCSSCTARASSTSARRIPICSTRGSTTC